MTCIGLSTSCDTCLVGQLTLLSTSDMIVSYLLSLGACIQDLLGVAINTLLLQSLLCLLVTTLLTERGQGVARALLLGGLVLLGQILHPLLGSLLFGLYLGIGRELRVTGRLVANEDVVDSADTIVVGYGRGYDGCRSRKKDNSEEKRDLHGE